jgi:hypothetical protein
MKVGCNKRYFYHCLLCREWIGRTSKLLILTAILFSFLFKYPVSTGVLLREISSPEQGAVVEASFIPPVPEPGTVASITAMLARYGVDDSLRERVAKAIVTSGVKYHIDPRLVASIMIVESRANPFAVSQSDAVGIMQIHLPTWGPLADQQGINLFKIEDNADLGVRILSGYIAAHGIWGGVARYNGQTDEPDLQGGTAEYVQKVQKIYGYSAPVTSPPLEAPQASLQ